MADEKDLKEVISRVTNAVYREMKGHEAEGFQVSDLRRQVEELGAIGDKVAWKITYDTSGDKIVSLGDRIVSLGDRAGGPVAWKITYDTSGDVIVRGGREKK